MTYPWVPAVELSALALQTRPRLGPAALGSVGDMAGGKTRLSKPEGTFLRTGSALQGMVDNRVPHQYT